MPSDPNNVLGQGRIGATEGNGKSNGNGNGGLFDLISRALASHHGHACVSLEPLPPLDNAAPVSKKGNSSGSGSGGGSGSLAQAASEAGAGIAAGKGRARGLLPGRVYSIVEARQFYAEPTEERDGEHVSLVMNSDH